ncbi:MAG: hypothetical protein D6806_11580 [Deltaproteobacteria bacterium]|nr:MAG: hypothetical protein D6806_11580 [Deltaproteobacteria bacterium]
MEFSERIPEEMFEPVFLPAIRKIGAKRVILDLNAQARCAIPRQTPVGKLVPKLKLLCYTQRRAAVQQQLEQLFDRWLDGQLGDAAESFYQLSDELNEQLDGESVPKDERREKVVEIMGKLKSLFEQNGLTPAQAEYVFRVKAYPEVLELYLQNFGAGTRSDGEQE